MQRMVFTKINDSYEFPARLQLDRYLAPDAPEESRAQPNTYLLHSVLVHQGDVGGGHYYAYIRPGAGVEEVGEKFNYADAAARSTAAAAEAAAAAAATAAGGAEAMDDAMPGPAPAPAPAPMAADEHAARQGQWYKFNDETVIKVPPREAINHCYGKDPRAPPSFWSVGSAYMLVYIRESDVAKVMEPLGDADIPGALTERLDLQVLAEPFSLSPPPLSSLYLLPSNAPSTCRCPLTMPPRPDSPRFTIASPRFSPVLHLTVPPRVARVPIPRVQVAQRLAAERRVLREKTFKNVRYATEDDVRAFAAYFKVSPRAAGIHC